MAYSIYEKISADDFGNNCTPNQMEFFLLFEIAFTIFSKIYTMDKLTIIWFSI